MIIKDKAWNSSSYNPSNKAEEEYWTSPKCYIINIVLLVSVRVIPQMLYLEIPIFEYPKSIY